MAKQTQAPPASGGGPSYPRMSDVLTGLISNARKVESGELSRQSSRESRKNVEEYGREVNHFRLAATYGHSPLAPKIGEVMGVD